MEREIAPIPLASQGHAEQKGRFVKKQKHRDPHQDAPPLFWPAVPVPERSTQDEDQRKRQFGEMDSSIQWVTLIIHSVLQRGDIVGFPEVVHRRILPHFALS